MSQPASDDLFALWSEDDDTGVLNSAETQVLVPNTAQVRVRPALKRRNAVSQPPDAVQTSDRGNRAKHWCVTYNNPPMWPEVPKEWTEGVEFLVVGKEKAPTTGTLHYQMYVCFHDKIRMNQVKKHFGDDSVHCEMTRGTPQQNLEYCSKSETQVMEPYIYGILPAGKMSDRYAAAYAIAKTGTTEGIDPSVLIPHLGNLERIAERAKPRPSETAVECFWYWGEPGTGKSRRSRYEAGTFYVKDASKWWDGYNGEENVIIDDLDPTHVGMANLIKTWCDRYPFQAHIKGKMQLIRPSKIWITSNYRIDQVFQIADAKAIKRRFKVMEFLSEWIPPTLALNDDDLANIGVSEQDWIEILDE